MSTSSTRELRLRHLFERHATRVTIHNRRRGVARQQRLADEVAALERSVPAATGAEDLATGRRAMLDALLELSPAERESVLLTAGDGLSVALGVIRRDLWSATRSRLGPPSR